MQAGATVFFDGVDLGLGVEVFGLVSSTMAELQTIALALECVSSSSSVHLFSDSQMALDACKSELVKGYSGVLSNECADALAMAATMSEHSLLLHVNVCYILAGGVAVSENSKHFVRDIFCCIHYAQWEIGSGFRVLVTNLHGNVNWCRFSLVWHSDMHMAAGFIVSDHVFSCDSDTAIHAQLLDTHAVIWEALSNLLWLLSQLIQLMLSCVSDTLLCLAFCKGFMFKLCFQEVVSVFRDSKIACQRVVEFVQNFCFAFRDEVWLVHASHRALIEKHGLIPRAGSVPGLVHGLSLLFSAAVIKILGIAETFGISSGFRVPCLFFADIGDSVLVIIDA
ncbi:hypothetical protein G9A89_002203 [Geosiphon pyriformis]|nr:hypothetical protein G9A89_002203 [Geosiphon pyriformis]